MADPLDQITRLAGNLSPQLESFLATELEKLTYDVLAFQSMINKEVAIMSAGGIGSKGVADAIRADLKNNGRVFSTFKNNVKSGVVGANTGASRLGQKQIYDKAQGQDRWLWVAVGGHKVCLDCDARAGQVNTYSYWEKNGLPSSGWSVCKGFCYCVLDPVGNMDQKVKVPTAEEKKSILKSKKPKENILEKVFKSENKSMNKRFINAFENASPKFKEVLSKLPSLKHIGSSGGSGSFFTNSYSSDGFGRRIYGTLSKWIRKKGVVDQDSVQYIKKHGWINIKNPTSLRAKNTIRHEHGHFIHHNLHHVGQYTDMNKHIELYRRYKKLGYSYDEYLEKATMNVWVKGKGKIERLLTPNERKKIKSYLQFDDACNSVANKFAKDPKKYSEMADELYYKGYFGKGMPDRYKNKIQGLNRFSFDDDLIKFFNANMDSEDVGYIYDLFGALSGEKYYHTLDGIKRISRKIGGGHGQNYYRRSGIQMQHHETFANLTYAYNADSPLVWNFVKQEMPELAKYFEELMDEVIEGKLP